MYQTIKSCVFVSICAVCLLACKKWDDHTDALNPALNENLFQEISKRPALSKFTEYLVKTGLDKEVSSSKAHTVWAPVNEAWQTVAPAITNDTAALRKYISNLISGQTVYTGQAQSAIRVPLLNGKMGTFLKNTFEDATVSEADVTTGNGVLHVINKVVAPLSSAWEFATGTRAQYEQSEFIASQNFDFFDSTQATIDSISAVTGSPVYKPGTGVVSRNRFNDQVYDLKNEQKLYTFFVLNNAALKVETDSLLTFYKTVTANADSSRRLATMSVLRDAVVEGMYMPDQLPSSLVSRFGVTIPVDKSAIIETRKLSNGIVYVVNKLNFLTREKIPSLVAQGENPLQFLRPTGESVNVRGNTLYRVRTNPITGQTFNDMYIYNHGVSTMGVQYQLRNVPSARYRVYWVAVNDTVSVYTTRINAVPFQQRLLMGSRTATTFPYSTVAANVYTEVFMGEYTQATYGTLDMYLTAAASATAGVNSLSLDYIRLEPQF